MVEKRGRFWAAEPHFPSTRSGGDGRRSRGARRIVLASNRVYGPEGRDGERGRARARAAGPWRWPRGGDGGARIVRRIGRPDVARDAIEALMLDRGLVRGVRVADVSEAAERARDDGLAAALREVR